MSWAATTASGFTTFTNPLNSSDMPNNINNSTSNDSFSSPQYERVWSSHRKQWISDLGIREEPLPAKVPSTLEAAFCLWQPSIQQTSTVLDLLSWGSSQNQHAGLTWPFLSMAAAQSDDWALEFWSFKSPGCSVVHRQPKELQQLLVVCVDEVSRLLPTVVLQPWVSTQWQKVAERKHYG